MPANSTPLHTTGRVAAVDLAAYSPITAANTLANAGDPIVGFCVASCKADQRMSVVTTGTAEAWAGGAISDGALVQVGSGGTVVAATAGGRAIGRAMNAAAVAGDKVEVLLFSGNESGLGVTKNNANGQTVLDDASSNALLSTGVLPRVPYLGVVASRCAVPSSFASANKQLMARSKHIALDAITSLRLVYANWYVKNTATIGENTPGADTTYQAAIEYPSGTIAAIITFGGSTTGVAADGATIVSDAASVNIPVGAAFFVRTFCTSTAGILYRNGTGSLNTVVGSTTSGEGWTFGVTTPNLVTTAGALSNQQTGIYFGPTAIIGNTSRPTIFITGDSRENNGVAYDTASDGFGLTGETNRSLGKVFATLNVGCASERVNTIVNTPSLYARRLALIQYCTHVACGYGINDIIFDSRTAAQTLTDLQTLWSQFGGRPVYQRTLSPVSTSTDSWATTANQTTHANNAQRTSFNDSIRFMPAGLSGIFDVADQVESMRNSGIWKAGYTSDGTHGNQTANLAIQASGVVAMQSIR